MTKKKFSVITTVMLDMIIMVKIHKTEPGQPSIYCVYELSKTYADTKTVKTHTYTSNFD